jgi:meso-butanediol dehydrogenase/(S,S)-butanediol dehydrogenase/diacetyl reductase
MEMKNKICIVTGGTSGIGRATVIRFVEEGARVVFCGTNETKAKDVLAELAKRPAGGEARFMPCDVSDETQVKKMAAFTKEKYGPCEVLFNNAGIHVSGALHETPPDAWDKIMNVDLRGVYLVSYHVLPQMLAANYGTIINMASVSGVLADTSMAAYNAAKGAIVNLTRAMALDYATKNIRVNAVCPGAIRTDILENTFARVKGAEEKFTSAYPTHSIGSPVEVANTCVFLASRKSDFINGAMIMIDGGITAHTGQPFMGKY